jgi:hypothetical protein
MPPPPPPQTAGPLDEGDASRSPGAPTSPSAASPTVHPYGDSVQLCHDTSTPAGLLASRLQQLAQEVRRQRCPGCLRRRACT